MTQHVTGATSVAGIIGDPVAHSRSPAIWNAGFREAGLDWVFLAFEVKAEAIGPALAGVRALDIAALIVTMPHKSAAAGACDELSDTASALRAVNAIRNRDGRLCGDSTDGPGFVRSLQDAGVEPDGLRCLIVGAGGAGRAIARALGQVGAVVTVAARRPEAGRAAAELARDGTALVFSDIDGALDSIDVLVNATPIGMQGENPPYDVSRLRPGAVVADTVYHPLETPLLAAARSRGLACVDGLGMLVHQAAISFEAFTGAAAPLDAMRAAATADT